MKTQRKCRKHKPQASAFYSSVVFSNVNRLRLRHLFYDTYNYRGNVAKNTKTRFYTAIKHGFSTTKSSCSVLSWGFIRSQQPAKIAAYLVRIYLLLPPTLSVFSLKVIKIFISLLRNLVSSDGYSKTYWKPWWCMGQLAYIKNSLGKSSIVRNALGSPSLTLHSWQNIPFPPAKAYVVSAWLGLNRPIRVEDETSYVTFEWWPLAWTCSQAYQESWRDKL